MEIGKSTIIVGDFKTSPSVTNCLIYNMAPSISRLLPTLGLKGGVKDIVTSSQKERVM